MMNALMKLAPIGAGGAMAFTIGRYGIDALRPLALLMGSFYLTCLLFVLVVLGTIAAFTGFNILRFILYIKDELLTVLGTSSSESALVPLMQKLERLGCSRSVVGLVVPSGYSFNLDGTNIYLTMAALFVAQALNIELTLRQQLTLLGVAMLTSKGASGVTGAGFITLAATLAVVPSIPVAGLALILGIDRFMSEARSMTNFVGNGVVWPVRGGGRGGRGLVLGYTRFYYAARMCGVAAGDDIVQETFLAVLSQGADASIRQKVPVPAYSAQALPGIT